MMEVRFCPWCGNTAIYYNSGYNEEIYTCNECNKRFKVEDV